MFIMLPCSQRALILVLEYVGNFGVRLPPGCSRYGRVRVPCLYVRMLSLYATGWPVFPKCMQLTLVSWYVTSMLCCHCWMFSLSDALPMQSYPSNVWVLCQCGCATQLICLVLYKLWDVLFLFRSGFCMAESWARRLSLYLAFKPFLGLCACTRTSRWCASVGAIRSLSLFTNRAARSTV